MVNNNDALLLFPKVLIVISLTPFKLTSFLSLQKKIAVSSQLTKRLTYYYLSTNLFLKILNDEINNKYYKYYFQFIFGLYDFLIQYINYFFS